MSYVQPHNEGSLENPTDGCRGASLATHVTLHLVHAQTTLSFNISNTKWKFHYLTVAAEIVLKSPILRIYRILPNI